MLLDRQCLTLLISLVAPDPIPEIMASTGIIPHPLILERVDGAIKADATFIGGTRCSPSRGSVRMQVFVDEPGHLVCDIYDIKDLVGCTIQDLSEAVEYFNERVEALQDLKICSSPIRHPDIPDLKALILELGVQGDTKAVRFFERHLSFCLTEHSPWGIDR